MKHTRETVRRHLNPWVLLIWLVLIGAAAFVDHVDMLTAIYPEEVAK